MKDAAEWINRYRVFWEGQFDALDKFLADEEKEGSSTEQS
jgi:hypothetical protein